MAVQTHHPSNALHLKGNEQEINPPGFRVADQSSLFLSNIGGYGNLRKRGREIPVNGGSKFQMQSQPSRQEKIIRLDQLQQQQQSSHHHPAALVSTGLQLAFGEQNVNQINPPLLSSSAICEDFAGPVGQYSYELDQLLQAQGEELRKELAEKQRAHYKQLLLLAEKSASQVLEKKQTELDRLVGRSSELENQLGRLQAESFVWQSKAIQDQARATSIHAEIQRVIANAGGQYRGESPVDAGSACVGTNRDDRALCRACRNQAVSVVVLPCRHLCLCEDCDAVGAAQTCPVCDCVGNGSVRVFLC